MFTNRYSKIVVAIIVVAVALVTASMIDAGSTSVSVVESREQALREYQLGERYGEIPQNAAQFSAAQMRREYILGERYGVTPQKYTYELALREYWLGERYGQTPIVSSISVNGLEPYRQSEWLSVPIRLSNAEAYQIFRRGEVASPLSHAEAYHLFRLGEWVSVNVPASLGVDMTAYHLSERTLTDPKAGLAMYLLSERTLVDPQAGMATYFNSERTSFPVLFTKYQFSEWFSK